MKVRASLPICASAIFEMKVDRATWEKLTQEERIELFLDKSTSNGVLCHQCSRAVQTDFEPDHAMVGSELIDFEVECKEGK